MMLFDLKENGLLHGTFREDAAETLRKHHYLKCIPSGKSYYVRYEDALIVWSIPPNCNISTFLVGKPNVVWEMSRLWAPDGHRKNLLTQAISFGIRQLRAVEPTCAAVVSYADPNSGHHGGVYLAASWIPCGQSEETRYYLDSKGQRVARRTYVRGKQRDTTELVAQLGIHSVKRPGKLRFAHPLKRWARRELEKRFPLFEPPRPRQLEVLP